MKPDRFDHSQSQFKGFSLLQRSLFEHLKGAVVMASYDTYIGPIGGLNRALLEKLEDVGMPSSEARHWLHDADYKDPAAEISQAHFRPRPTDKLLYDIILSGYVPLNHRGLDVNERVRLGTKNALELAREREISSIGFPLLGTGGEGGTPFDIAPIMAEEFAKDTAERGPGLEKTLYVYDEPTHHSVWERLDRLGFGNFS